MHKKTRNQNLIPGWMVLRSKLFAFSARFLVTWFHPIKHLHGHWVAFMTPTLDGKIHLVSKIQHFDACQIAIHGDDARHMLQANAYLLHLAKKGFVCQGFFDAVSTWDKVFFLLLEKLSSFIHTIWICLCVFIDLLDTRNLSINNTKVPHLKRTIHRTTSEFP